MLRSQHQLSYSNIFRVSSIEAEKGVLGACIELLQMSQQQYEYAFNLSDKSIGYQEYFIQVYHHEKCLILSTQIAMLHKLIAILNALQSGKTKEEAVQVLTNS
jgi:hypothetical protein